LHFEPHSTKMRPSNIAVLFLFATFSCAIEVIWVTSFVDTECNVVDQAHTFFRLDQLCYQEDTSTGGSFIYTVIDNYNATVCIAADGACENLDQCQQFTNGVCVPKNANDPYNRILFW